MVFNFSNKFTFFSLFITTQKTPHVRSGEQFPSGGLHFYNKNSHGVFISLISCIVGPAFQSSKIRRWVAWRCMIHVGSTLFFYHRSIVVSWPKQRGTFIMLQLRVPLLLTSLILCSLWTMGNFFCMKIWFQPQTAIFLI